MSVRAMSIVWDSKVEHTRKIILLYYADRASDEGENAWPAINTVATKTGLSKRTVQRMIKDMVARGWMTPAGKSKYATIRYSLNFAMISAYQPPEGGDIDDMFPAEGVTSTTGRGDIDDIKGVTSTTKTSDTVSPEPSLTTIKPSFNHQCVENKKSSAEEVLNRMRNDPNLKLWGETGVTLKVSDPILEYPADIQNWLREFTKRWPLDIPERPRSGKQTGQFAQWIGELRALAVASSEIGVGILEHVYQDWEKSQFTVSHPAALLNVIRAKVAVLRNQSRGVGEKKPYVDGVYQGDHSDANFQKWQAEHAKKQAASAEK